MATNLGLIDIFSLLGKMSRRLQKVELFPWEISQIQDELVSTLRQMSNIKLIDDESDRPVFDQELDKNQWPALSKDLDNIMRGEYKGQETTVFEVFRRGRSGDDIMQSSLRVLTTVQNRLGSLSRAIADIFIERLGREKDHKSSKNARLNT